MSDLFKTTPKNYETLNGKSFKEKFTQAARAELVDVRTADEFKSGTLPGARNLDFLTGELQAIISKLDQNKAYFIFCGSGNRSDSACKLMADQGLKVYNLAGGISSWPM